MLKQPELLLNNVSTIVKNLLNETNLLYLGAHPLCGKQIIAMWKIRLTREIVGIDTSHKITPLKKKIYRIVPHAVSRGHLLVAGQRRFK